LGKVAEQNGIAPQVRVLKPDKPEPKMGG